MSGRGAVVLLVFGFVGLAVAGCSPAPSHAVTNQAVTTVTAAPTTTEAPPLPSVPFTITGAGFDMQAAGTVPKAASDAAWAGVLATLNRYLEAGVLTPLRSGGPAGDLAPLFAGPAAARVVTPGPDRAAFIDEGLPPADGISATSAVATLSGLAGADGTVSVVSATLDLHLDARVAGTPLTIARTGELVLLPEGGTWRIDAYDLQVSRDSVAPVTSTTTRVHT